MGPRCGVLVDGWICPLDWVHGLLRAGSGRRPWPEMDVEVRVNSLAVDMDHHSITVKGPDGLETIRARTLIWAAGVKASPLARVLAERTGAETDRASRVAGEPRLHPAGSPGGLRHWRHGLAEQAAGVAQPAIQEGRYVAGVIKARLEGDKVPAPFEYHDKGSMATIGHMHAVADAFGLKLTGLPAYAMWGLVHVAYLIDWGNRLGTLYAWSQALYAINNRGNRVITFHQASDELGQGRIRAVQPTPDLS